MEKGDTSKAYFWILLIISLSLVHIDPCFSGPGHGQAGFRAKALIQISWSTVDDSIQVDIKGDGFLPNYSIFQLSDPSRLVLDFPEMTNATGKANIQIGQKLLDSIRIGQHPEKARVVFEFAGGIIPRNRIEKKENTLTLFFYDSKTKEELQQGGKQRWTEESRTEETELRDRKPSYGERKVSLDFKEADIRLVLQKIAEAARQKLIVSDAVQGKITLRLIDIPWQEALGAILRTRNLAIIREGDVLEIVTQEEYNKKEK
jgi:hypothetical protein